MNDIKYIDNLLPAGYANHIEEDLTRFKFPWYFVNDVTYVSKQEAYGDNCGLVHVAYDYSEGPPSEWYPFIKPLVYSIEEATETKIDQLLRIRVGFLYKTFQDDHSYNTPHVDFLFPHLTACYYATDSDGDTILFDKMLSNVGTDINDRTLMEYTKSADFNIVSRATPKKNSLCVFDGLRFHSSSKPKAHDRRLVITVNYVPQR